MTTTETEAPEIPEPTFPHHAYGVDLTWFGDEGGMIARGHVPDLRFVAACNHLARTEAGLSNIWDDRAVMLKDALAEVRREWAVPIDPGGFGSDWEWAIRYGGVTEQTPGAFPITTLCP